MAYKKLSHDVENAVLGRRDNLKGYEDEGYFAEQKIFLHSNYHYASNFHNVWTLFCDFDDVL